MRWKNWLDNDSLFYFQILSISAMFSGTYINSIICKSAVYLVFDYFIELLKSCFVGGA